jgi:hypothetical protein
MYLFLDFILKTLTFAPLYCSRTLNSIFEPATVGVPILVSFPSSSEINNASVLEVVLISKANFLTSTISPTFTLNWFQPNSIIAIIFFSLII